MYFAVTRKIVLAAKKRLLMEPLLLINKCICFEDLGNKRVHLGQHIFHLQQQTVARVLNFFNLRERS